jgi:predicted nucleotide-binding protein (sugar kinase/HSP70/actin superfamily)
MLIASSCPSSFTRIKTVNSYNCPIITGYSEVIRSAIDPAIKYGIPFDSPTFTFKDEKLKKKSCITYIQSLPGKALSKKDIEKAYNKAVEEQALYERTLTNRCQEVLKNAKDKNHLVVLLAGRPYHSDPLIQHKIAELIANYGVDVITEDIVRKSEGSVNMVQSIMQWAYTNRILKAAAWAAEADENIHYIELTSFGCGPDAFIIDEVSDILRRGGKSATFLKIDDINNIGSMRLRIRSLIESLRYRTKVKNIRSTKITQTKPYFKGDRKRTLLLPWFADFYSPFLPPAFKLAGYNAINLPPSDEKSVEFGLKYSNNEICYPATLIVGDFMKALDSGKYKTDEIALAISQTGGQCRATNYTSLLKKALIAAGLEQIPIVTIAMGGGINEQPGFKVDWKKIYKVLIYGVVYADFLSQMYYSTAPREKEKGSALRIKDESIQLGIKAIEDNDPEQFLNLASLANRRFTEALKLKKVPKIGVVGEIYVKYNSFGQKDIVNWLVQQGIETVLPPITNFFTSSFVSQAARESGNVSKRSVPKYLYNFAEHYIYNIVHKMEEQVRSFPYFRPFETPEHLGEAASRIINLNTQFGEGWSIPGEYAHFAESGVNSVVSLQPFGCIANQIISKGIEKRTRELYPNLNLLFLDFDSGMSEANIVNRLHFMIENKN